MNDPLPEVLRERLQGVKANGRGWQALCPAHADTNPSLSVTVADNGRVLLKCHSGCSFEEIRAALGIEAKDLGPNGNAHSKLKREITAEFDYLNEESIMLFQKVKYVPKDFRIRRRDPNAPDGWAWNLNGCRKVLFKLPELLTGIRNRQTIFVAEGEKDVLSLQHAGFVATTWPFGAAQPGQSMAKKWLPEFTETLKGAVRVVLPADCDAAGRHAMRYIAGELIKAGVKDVHIVDLGGPEHFDVTDYLQTHSADELLALADAAPIFDPNVQPEEAVIESVEPLRLAEGFIRKHFSAGDVRLLRRHQGAWWRYADPGYEQLPDEDLTARLWGHLDGLTVNQKKLIPKRNLVGEVTAALTACGILTPGAMPLWLDGRREPDPKEIVACRNGLLHIGTRRLMPSTPAFFSSSVLPYSYDPKAVEPSEWLMFLHSLWPKDPDSIQVLREWFGYCLTPDTRQQKILLAVGPKRGGKGTIARVLTGLVGMSNVSAPTLSTLSSNFGLSVLLNKPIAIISDARLSGRTDQSAVVERLLTISGEDAVTIDRKYAEPITVTLPTRFMVLTNELPRLADTSGALASRFIVLSLTKSFFGVEDTGLTNRLLAELPATLNWALAGYDALRERGHFLQPETSASAIQDLEDLGSPVGAFVRSCCVVENGAEVGCRELFDAWKAYCEQSGREHPGSVQSFGRDIRAAYPEIDTYQPRDEGAQKQRYYMGIGLKR